MMTDLVPWLAMLALLGLEARSRAAPAAGTRRLGESAVGAALLILSCGMHAVGSLSKAAAGGWNLHPISVDRAPQRLWDWSDPQFLAWRADRPHVSRRRLTM